MDIRDRVSIYSTKARNAIALARMGGIGTLLTSLRPGLYSQIILEGLERNLADQDIEINSQVKYYLQRATARDIEEIYRKAQVEKPASRQELIIRKRFFDIGFHNCYIARDALNDDICYMQWMISWKDENAGSPDFMMRFKRLGQLDVQLEHAYTFEKYRGKKVMPAVMNDLFRIARERGFKRVITYVGADNIASLKGCQKVGFQKYEEIHWRRILFFQYYRIVSLRGGLERGFTQCGQPCKPYSSF